MSPTSKNTDSNEALLAIDWLLWEQARLIVEQRLDAQDAEAKKGPGRRDADPGVDDTK